jgi:hypothetical protein
MTMTLAMTTLCAGDDDDAGGDDALRIDRRDLLGEALGRSLCVA